MSAMEILTVLTGMFGGLALFLFGMDTMSDSLSSMTGGVLNRLLGVVTKNRFTAFLFGTCLTAIVQSSSAVSVLTVGLVNSGIIKLQQAIGLLIGGGLGSTATAWILSLNALDGASFLMTLIKPSTSAPFLAVIAVAITMFAKNEKLINIAHAILGFSVMMIGMNLMGQGVAPLKELPALKAALVSFSNPLFGFLFALVFTMLIQSSDATIGIVQAFALSVGVSFASAIPLICGAQVGTCVTALISSLGASNNGKRTALMNLYYALLKVVSFMVLFYAASAIRHFSFMNDPVGSIGIPLWHTGINIFGALLWIPGSSFIVLLANKTIPLNEEERQARENMLTMLDENLLPNIAIALKQTDRAVCIQARTVGETMQFIIRHDPENEKETRKLLRRIASYREQIEHYLMELSARAANTDAARYVMLLTNVNTAFGEIGAIMERLHENIPRFIESGSAELLSDQDKVEIRVLGSAISEILELTITGYESKNALLSNTMQVYREEFMAMSDVVKRRHIRQMHGAEGRRMATTTFTDICYTQEKLIDYCDIVADALIKYNVVIGKNKAVTARDTEETRSNVRKLFEDKYQLLQLEMGEDGRITDAAL
ncbi:MAG: Na/Pi symporter [Lachnospiraceae bacterium]|nr:Na/Pi symporter [Lachnospiraceae bacterium]